MHHSTILRCSILAFVAGVLASSFLSVPVWMLGSGAIVCASGIILAPSRRSIAIMAIALSSVLGAWRMTAVSTRPHTLDYLIDTMSNGKRQTTTLVGTVAEDPASDSKKQKIILAVDSERVLVATDPEPAYHYGDQLRITGYLGIPQNIPGSSFDYAASLARDGVYYEMNNAKIEVASFPRGIWERVVVSTYRGIYAARDAFTGSLNRVLPKPYGAFMAGVLIGSRSNLPGSIKQDFARTGTSHIIAVSGYNITIIADTLAAILLLRMRRARAFWVTLIVLCVFMILTGGQASVIRATIMGIIGLTAKYAGRLNISFHTLVLTAGIMIALDPMILRYDIGFQLSFMATVGILFVAPLIEERLPLLQQWGIIGETLIMTTSAQLCVLPILVYYFKSVSLISLPANLLVLPWIPLTMALGFATGITGMIAPALGHFIGYLAWILSAALLSIIHFFSSIPWAAVQLEITGYTMIATYVLMGILYWHLEKRRNSMYNQNRNES